MAKKQAEPKIVLEREYIVPLRHGWLKVPKHKRAMKAVKTLKEFIAQHMKVYDRDLRKIKLDIDLNNEIRFKGMRKPLAKIKVKAIKYDTGIVRVNLVDIPEKIKFKRLKELKKLEPVKKKAEIKSTEEKKKEEKPSEKKKKETKLEEIAKEKDIKEKEAASMEETQKLAKEEAKKQKHVSKDNKSNEVIENRKKRSQSGH